eukprot:1204935-Amphidinium_carterae.2
MDGAINIRREATPALLLASLQHLAMRNVFALQLWVQPLRHVHEEMQSMKKLVGMLEVAVPATYERATVACGEAAVTMAEGMAMAIISHDKLKKEEKQERLAKVWTQLQQDGQEYNMDLKAKLHSVLSHEVMQFRLQK